MSPGSNRNILGFCHIYFLLILFQLVSWSTTFPAFGGSDRLYNSQHFVYSLNASTINRHIYSSDRAWFVEFYSSWCGHCIAFAPKWIQFADDLKEWRSVVVVAAIDCADEVNVPTCRQQEILAYPTLKLFPPHSPEMLKEPDGSEKLNIFQSFKRTESMPTLKTNLITSLAPMFNKLLGTADSSPARSFAFPVDFWNSPEFSNISFLLLIYENAESTMGMEVTLRLSRYNSTVRVLRFHEKNPMYQHLNLNGWPAAGYLTNDSHSGTLLLGNNQDLVDLLTTATIGLANITKIEEKPEQSGDSGDHSTDILRSENSINEDNVSMEDLLHTIRNSLRNEIGLLQQVDGTKLVALKNYISILSQYFPSDRRDVKMFLVKLLNWVQPQVEIKNAVYLEKLNELETEYKPWDIDLAVWYDCKATVPGRRGYTCGLWRLFHVLTVIAFEKHEDSQILPAIHGYVTEFFGCQECSKHFGEMVDRDKALQLQAIQDQMMWLWKAHNEVNIRLIGTPSEDQGYPKGYYPTEKNCRDCYETPATHSFDETKVKEYLVKIYARPKRFLDSDGKKTIKDSADSTASKLQINSSWLGGYFSMADIGIFMILYLCIALLLVFAYILLEL